MPISPRQTIRDVVRREAAQQGEQREDRRSREEDPATAEHVGQPPAGDDQHPEDQRVGVDHPLDRRDVGVVVASICGRATLSAVKSLAMTKTPSAIATSATTVARSSGVDLATIGATLLEHPTPF